MFYFIISVVLSVVSLFLKEIKILFKFNLSLSTIILLIIFLIIIFIIEFFITNKEDKKNLEKIEILFPKTANIGYITLICLLGAYSEEMLFRAFLPLFIKNILYLFIKNSILINIIILVIISLLFGILHLSQGISGFIFSSIASVIFFISIFMSATIIYAIIAHFLFNFIELTLIIPYKRKKIYT